VSSGTLAPPVEYN